MSDAAKSGVLRGTLPFNYMLFVKYLGGNKVLFPIVTIIIMETFINKMRRLKGIRKMILLEEAWKAISKEGIY